MNKYYVYIYFDPSRDNEPIYVGKGKGTRYKYHLKRTDKNLFPNRLNSMKENGVQPIIKKIHFESEELALNVEKYLISQLGRYDLSKGPLLNLTDGGEGISGLIFTDSHRANMRASHRAIEDKESFIDAIKSGMNTVEAKTKMSLANRGKSRSLETRTKMSKAKLNKPKSETAKLNMSLAKLNKPLLTCPHCGKSSIANMKRYHFDNCKLTPNLLVF